MTNSNIPKVITKGTTEMRSGGGLSAANNTQNPRCHSRVVKSSMYYQSSVVPSRGKHKQGGEGNHNAAESGDKSKMRGNKQMERVTTGRPSPNPALPSARQGSPILKQNQSRSSPSREERSSPGSSPTLGCFYAGAKFSAPPMPEAIPRPPSHWTTTIRMSSGGFPLLTAGQDANCRHEINTSLKMLLNVPA